MFLVLVSIFSMKTDQDERQMAKEESEVERNELTCKWTASWTFKNMILSGSILRSIKSPSSGFAHRCYNFCSHVAILM